MSATHRPQPVARVLGSRTKTSLWTFAFDDDSRGILPDLRKLVPEGKEIIQNLHHVFNLGATRAYLTIGDSRKLLGTVEMNFGVRVQAAYGAVLKHCCDLLYSWAYLCRQSLHTYFLRTKLWPRYYTNTHPL